MRAFRPKNQPASSLLDVPSLMSAGARLEREWLLTYLDSPHDVRPRLQEAMPRLNLRPSQRTAIVDGLLAGRAPAPKSPKPSKKNVEDGRALLLTRGCTGCHNFGGAVRASPGLPSAPDLAHARARMDPDRLVAWIVDPQSLSPTTSMPSFTGTRAQAIRIRDFLLLAEPEWTVPAVDDVLIPPLERPVRWAEVRDKVFGRMCEDCHLDPAAPQNADRWSPGRQGGFGWPAAGIQLQTAAGVRAVADRVVPALLRRRQEARRDHLRPGQRPAASHQVEKPGMPMGYPPLSDYQIALVSAWIAQGLPE